MNQEETKFRVVRNFPPVALSTAKVYRVESVELLTEDEAEKLAEMLNGEPLNRYKDKR
jgi:hypothetical protein